MSATPLPEAGACNGTPPALSLARLDRRPAVLAFAFLFLILPTLYLASEQLQELQARLRQTVVRPDDALNTRTLATPNILDAYKTSIEISLVTAIAGASFGFLSPTRSSPAAAAPFLRSALMTFSGVRQLRRIPSRCVHLHPGASADHAVHQGRGFSINIYSKFALELAYMYFSSRSWC